jgi:type II secretory pathway pseudopilin PulG
MSGPRTRARAFSLVELMLVVVVVFMLMGLLLGGFRFARNYGKRTADRTTVKSLQQAVSFFSQQMGFLPPLVKDMGDPQGFTGDPIRTVNGENRPNTYSASVPAELVFLRTSPPAATQPDMRFSIYSYAYYLLGACDEPRTNPPATPPNPIDGVPGPGMFAAKRDGTFERSGKRFEPFFDTARNAKAVVTDTVTGGPGRVELRDSNNVAFRYYRWEHGQPAGAQMGQVVTEADLNVPVILGTLADNPALKGAKYAILAAGPNGVFGNEDQLPNGHPQQLTSDQLMAKVNLSGNWGDPNFVARVRAKAMEDNIVEVGK